MVILGPLEDDFSYAFLREQTVWGSVSKYARFSSWERGINHYGAYLIPINIHQGMIWSSLRPWVSFLYVNWVQWLDEETWITIDNYTAMCHNLYEVRIDWALFPYKWTSSGQLLKLTSISYREKRERIQHRWEGDSAQWLAVETCTWCPSMRSLQGGDWPKKKEKKNRERKLLDLSVQRYKIREFQNYWPFCYLNGNRCGSPATLTPWARNILRIQV